MTTQDSALLLDLAALSYTRLTTLDRTYRPSCHHMHKLNSTAGADICFGITLGRSLVTVCMLLLLVPVAVVPATASVASDRAPIRPPFLELPAAGSSASCWWVGASSTDSSALPNNGVRGTIQVASQQVNGLLSFWVSDQLSNNFWGQVGYYFYMSSTPVAFYQIWNMTSGVVMKSGTSSVSLGSHQFSMYLQSGTTWAFALDGRVFGTYDMHSSISSSSYPVYALSEEGYATSVFSFSPVTFLSAMEVLKSGTWSPVQLANSFGNAWGVQGAAQNSNLAGDQILVSTSMPALGAGTVLWDGSITTLPSPDMTSPTVSIAFPTNGAPVSGTVSISASASDNVGVTNVELYKDGSLLASLTNPPYTFSWDTTKDQDGAHTLLAKAYDATNNVGTSKTATLSIDNTQPQVTTTSPLSGATVKGSVAISVTASDTSGIQRVEFYVDGALKATDYTTPYTYQWNSKTVKAGTHTILVIAYDKAGNMKQASITVISAGK